MSEPLGSPFVRHLRAVIRAGTLGRSIHDTKHNVQRYSRSVQTGAPGPTLVSGVG